MNLRATRGARGVNGGGGGGGGESNEGGQNSIVRKATRCKDAELMFVLLRSESGGRCREKTETVRKRMNGPAEVAQEVLDLSIVYAMESICYYFIRGSSIGHHFVDLRIGIMLSRLFPPRWRTNGELVAGLACLSEI